MKKKPAAKSSKVRTTRSAAKDLPATKGQGVKGGAEPTKHPAKVTVPDLR